MATFNFSNGDTTLRSPENSVQAMVNQIQQRQDLLAQRQRAQQEQLASLDALFQRCFTVIELHGSGQVHPESRNGRVADPIIHSEPSPLHVYSGYRDEHVEMLRHFVKQRARKEIDRFVDGFGQHTLYKCVPFDKSVVFDLSRLTLPIPDDGVHAEGAEYVAVADSVRRAGDMYSVVELGAGWGPWLALSALLARGRGIQEVQLVGVEALPARFALLKEHLFINKLRPESGEDTVLDDIHCRLIQGAATPVRTQLWFPDLPVEDMGSAASDQDSAFDYRGRPVTNLTVEGYPLSEIVGDSMVDFLHIDIQGTEYELISANVDLLDHQVGSLMVATHSRVIEGKLIELLYSRGWHLELEKPCRVDWVARPVSQAGMTTVDGCQYWIRGCAD
jgi:hypothetical protein